MATGISHATGPAEQHCLQCQLPDGGPLCQQEHHIPGAGLRRQWSTGPTAGASAGRRRQALTHAAHSPDGDRCRWAPTPAVPAAWHAVLRKPDSSPETCLCSAMTQALHAHACFWPSKTASGSSTHSYGMHVCWHAPCSARPSAPAGVLALGFAAVLSLLFRHWEAIEAHGAHAARQPLAHPLLQQASPLYLCTPNHLHDSQQMSCMSKCNLKPAPWHTWQGHPAVVRPAFLTQVGLTFTCSMDWGADMQACCMQAEQGEAHSAAAGRLLRRRTSISPLLGISPIEFLEPAAERELPSTDVFSLAGASIHMPPCAHGYHPCPSCICWDRSLAHHGLQYRL